MTSGEGAAPTGDAAVDDAIARMRAAQHGTGPGEAGTVDADVLRTALATLPDTEQRILWDHHVLGRALDALADSLGLHVRAVARHLRRAEERLALALSAAHARGVPQRLCAETRSGLHDYVNHRLGGGRRQALEDHLFACAGCLRAFIDVRESGWALRDAAPVLLAPLAASSLAVPVVVGALGQSASTGAAGWLAGLGAGLAGAWEWLVGGVRKLVAQPVGLAAGAAAAVVAVAAVAAGLAPGAEQTPPVQPVAASSAPVDGDVEKATVPTPSPDDVTDPTPAPAPSAAPSSSAEAVELDGGGASAGTGTTGAAPTDDDDGPGGGRDAEGLDGDSDAGARDSDDVPADRGGDAASDPQPDRDPGAPTSEPADPSPTQGPADPGEPTAPEGPAEPSAPPSTPAPDPAPEPDPEPEPEPEPVPATASVTLTVGGFGWFQVVPTGGAEIVDVVGGGRTEVSQDRRGRWWVRAVGSRDREVTVEVTGDAGSEPGARLSWFGLER